MDDSGVYFSRAKLMRSLQLFTLALLATAAIPARADSLTIGTAECALGSGSYGGGATPYSYGAFIQDCIVGVNGIRGGVGSFWIDPSGGLTFQTGNLSGSSSSG